jgi:Rieske 2Fe-2S family protein
VFGPLLGKFAQWRIEELRSVHQTVYEVEANWKLFFQNYSECYHCPPVHKVLNKLTPYRGSVNDLDEGPFLGGPMKMSAGRGSSMTMSGRACGTTLGEVSGDDLGLVYYYTIFPSMFLSLHPDYVLVHRGVPVAASHTRIYCDWYFHPDAIDAPGFDPVEAIEFWDMTNREDWDLCTIAQQGISSRAYTPGPYAELESQLAAFDREYLRALGRGTQGNSD